MDEWDDDAYGVIYDKQDRERSFKSSNGKNPSGNACCGSIFILIVIGLVIAVVL